MKIVERINNLRLIDLIYLLIFAGIVVVAIILSVRDLLR